MCSSDLPEQVVAVLAVLAAGGAWLPIDPSWPAERRDAVLADARVAGVVGTGAAPWAIAVTDATREDAPPAQVSSDNLAYVIYTSGTTGRPKGALIPHANVLRLLDQTAPWFEFGDDDTWTLFHSLAFDFSVWELFGALCTGGRLVVVNDAVARDPAAFHALLVAERVTVLNQKIGRAHV